MRLRSITTARAILPLSTIFLASAGFDVMAQPRTASEYEVKAAFLVNFARFAEWPAESIPAAGLPLTICTMGQNPFGQALEAVTTGKSIDGRPLEVRHAPDGKHAAGCQVLFVAAGEHPRPADSLPTPGVLTVGEDGNPEAGNMVIHFTIDNGKVRFVVNLEAAEREKLRLSSRLLGLATVVKK